MDDLDRRIIKELQENFPLEINPYGILAETLAIDVDELWRRVVDLVESGVIRRIGFSIDSRKMGYSSTLVAVRIPPEQVDKACELIDRYPQITHSYLREDAFNIWFTVIAEDRSQITKILDEIRIKLDLAEEKVMNFPVEKLFKLDARFK
ncbi:MAG: Lrp/AsnC family transcriptional regulator [Phycisphaerae bacterium]|nr:Lrp/AsnC family transcriptional regulator [Phycisphaerae bacterium]